MIYRITEWQKISDEETEDKMGKWIIFNTELDNIPFFILSYYMISLLLVGLYFR